jgi:hypothetical protein
LEKINKQNKKLCPVTNCNSILELKDINNKEVICSNNHTYCFICLEKPHGNSPCQENLLKSSMAEYSKNNLIKRCPKCNIITEKVTGCNHITCTKCNYQWCWLCNGEYDPEHYSRGKCRGFQFFLPHNEEEIKDAFKGKIKLRASQRQEDIDYSEQNEIILNKSFNNQRQNLFISSDDIPAQNNINQSADLVLLAKNYVLDSESDENNQNEEINQNEEQNEADDNDNDNLNNEQNNDNGNENDNSDLNNRMNNEQNNADLNISNNENNSLNNNNDNLFSNKIDERENKIEDKDGNFNGDINNSNRNISGEINDINNSYNEKKDLDGTNSNNQNKDNIENNININKEDNNVIDQNVNNDLNHLKLTDKNEDNIINSNNNILLIIIIMKI